MKKINKFKIIVIVCVVIVIILGIDFIKEQIAISKVASDMATDSSLREITGMWDEDNMDKYNCIAIPEPDYIVSTMQYGLYEEYAKVVSIGEGAFQGNVYVETVFIPDNIVLIKKNAFEGCNNIEKVLYSGTYEQWNQIVIEEGNDPLIEADIVYNADMPESNDYGKNID